MANLLTFFRIVLILPFVACFFIGGDWSRWVAFALFAIAGVTDFFDGYIARRLNQTSALGAALDPIADKLLTSVALVLLIMDRTLTDLHVIVALIIILREFWVAGLREALAGEISIPVTFLAKWKTAIQFIAIALLLLPAPDIARAIGVFFLWAGAAITVWTGKHYTQLALQHLRKKQA